MCRTTSAPKYYSCGHRDETLEYVDCKEWEENEACATRDTVDYWAGSKRVKGDRPTCVEKKAKEEETAGDSTFETQFLTLIAEHKNRPQNRKISYRRRRGRKLLCSIQIFLVFELVFWDRISLERS